MKKIAAIALTTIAVFLTSCGQSYTPEYIAGPITEQINKWVSFQTKYATVNAKAGSDAEIGYKFESAYGDILKSYFKQETTINGNLATFTLKAKKNIGDCKNGVWTTIYNVENPANPIRVTIAGENCETLISSIICSIASSHQCGMEEVIVKDPAEDAKKELEAAAEKWKKELKAPSNTDNFTFKVSEPMDGEGSYSLKATSKVKIGDCPAKSTWDMGYEGCERWNNPPKDKKCSSLTPKVITDYKGDSGC